MRILLLGTGYIGIALLEQWGRKDDRFVVTTTRKERLAELETRAQVERALVLEGADREGLAGACVGCDAIVVTVAPRSGRSYEETYLKTAQNLVAVAPASAYLLYTSSTSVYGDHDGQDVDEQSERRGKPVLIATEDVYLSRPNSCILRLGGIHGPGRSLKQRAERLSGKVLSGLPEQRVNNSHRDLIVQAMQAAILQQAKGIYNVVDPEHPTRRELYGGLCQSLGIPEPGWEGGESARGSNAVVRARRLRDLLES